MLLPLPHPAAAASCLLLQPVLEHAVLVSDRATADHQLYLKHSRQAKDRPDLSHSAAGVLPGAAGNTAPRYCSDACSAARAALDARMGPVLPALQVQYKYAVSL